MNTEPPNLPPELRDRLQEESITERADLEAVWNLLGTVEHTPSDGADPDRAWEQITAEKPELADLSENGSAQTDTNQLDARTESHRRERPSRQPSHGRRRRGALGLVLAMLLLVGGIWLWRQPTTVTAPAGKRHTTTLPDGSTVELNSGSTIAFRRGFQAWPLVEAGRRVVTLKGEAFFDVTDRDQPFTVQTENANVAVLGTRFNVRARQQESATQVTVLHGRIRVAPRTRPNNSVVLADSGQTSRVTDASATPTEPRSSNVNRVLAWRNEGFAVHAKPLSVVVEELEWRYAKEIQLHSSVSRTEDPVSLYYPGPTDLETILHDLCTARRLNYRSTSRGFELFASEDDR